MSEVLLLGEIGNMSTPTVGGELYFLSSASFGQQVASAGGADSALDIITPDMAPAGSGGVVNLRRIYVNVAWSLGGFTMRVTPIVDFERELDRTSFAFEAPPKRRTKTVTVPVAARCTWVACRIEIVARSGLVEILGWAGGFLPIKQVAAQVGRE